MQTLEIITIIEIISISVVGFLAWRIGVRQNEINSQFLGLSDYADVFLMPQTLTQKVDDNKTKTVGYTLLIKNASSYPIYLNQYIINGIKYEVGASIIPANSENWYQVPLTKDIQNTGKFFIEIYFEDFTGRKYKTEGYGEFDGGWSVKSKKRIEVK